MMQTERHFPGAVIAMVSAVMGTFFLVACQQSQTPAPAPSTTVESKAASTEKVFVVFEGPWAIVPDPKDDAALAAHQTARFCHSDPSF